MKHTLFLLLSIFCIGLIQAQDLTSKDGEMILPQAKNWSIGLDATKLIKNANADFISSSQAITGKYFKDAKTAYRFGVRIGLNNWTNKQMVIDRAAATNSVIAYPAAKAMKENEWKRFATAVGLSAGIEKRRGSGRLQGLYGVEFAFYLSSSTDKFSYGNALNASSLSPINVDESADAMSSTALGNANNIDTLPAIQNAISNSARVLERKNGLSFSIGARTFVGAEYFVLPKMSVGCEFGWGLGYTKTGRSETILESIGSGNTSGNALQSVKRTTIDGGSSGHLRLDTDNSSILGGISASLRLNLYF